MNKLSWYEELQGKKVIINSQEAIIKNVICGRITAYLPNKKTYTINVVDYFNGLTNWINE